jgi:hypothetical protein
MLFPLTGASYQHSGQRSAARTIAIRIDPHIMDARLSHRAAASLYESTPDSKTKRKLCDRIKMNEERGFAYKNRVSEWKAGVAELADALDSKSSGRKAVWVRAPPPAMKFSIVC